MKKYVHRFISWWFATMVPLRTPPTTISERETLRKRRLLSSILLFNFMMISFFLVNGFLMGLPMLQQANSVFTCAFLVLVLWINRRGYLKSASFLFAFLILITAFSVIMTLSLKIPIFTFTAWVLLLIIPIMMGLLLPAWSPIFLTFIEIAFMIWFILDGRRSQINVYMPDPNVRQQFLLFVCSIFFGIGLFSAIYASTTRKAVIQADRAIELELAHQTISIAYANLAQAHDTIQKQALTDALTGLPNHRAIMDQLMKEVNRAGRYNRPFSLLFFDADRFKRVNDTYGHAAGDAVLRQLGERTGSVLRGGDTLGRFGGEEFVVLLPEADSNEASVIAERIRAKVASEVVAPAEVEGGIAATVSIGIATYLLDGESEHELLSQADEAMYVAKRMGRNQIRTALEARQLGADVEFMALMREEGQREIAKREGFTPEQLREIYTLRSVTSLLSILERRDTGLSAHALAVSDLATHIAQKSGMKFNEITQIGTAALLHDIGKIAIPDVLLQKTGVLSLSERSLMQEHAVLGAQILEANPILFSLAVPVRHHHERWDGTGYPDQLAGEAIPLLARIIAVAEAYDAMQRACVYQTPLSPAEALAELQRCAGTQFDPTIVRLLSTVLVEQRTLQTIG